MEESTNPYAPPTAAPELVPEDLSLLPVRLASRWARLGALIIDAIVLGVLIVLLEFVFDIASGMAGSVNPLAYDGYDDLITESVSICLSIVLYLMINGYLMVKFGQSIGKLVCRIQVVSINTHQLLSPGYIIGIRYVIPELLNLIPLFAFIDAVMIFGEKKRCLHDHMAGSIVINKNAMG